jgi:hypothetical protein
VSLNGEWGFDAAWGGKRSITVPFAWETSASGVGLTWLEHATYTRRIDLPDWGEARVFLCFGAVHYRATVFLDGRRLGAHTGGHTPFEFDLTELIPPGGAAILTVEVEAPADQSYLPHGKQRSIPRDDYDGVCFTPTSGIWQPVWLEARGRTYVADLRIDGTALDSFRIEGVLGGDRRPDGIVRITGPGMDAEMRSDREGRFQGEVPVIEPRLWSPADPFIYELGVIVGAGETADTLTATAGLRKIEAVGEELFLNGERLYIKGVLDQGYWPSAGLTAPSDAHLRQDLELAQRFGYNLVRKHLKLEDPRWLDMADRMGVLVWAEPPCPSRYSPAGAEAYVSQFTDWVARDFNHPSIVIWGLYNEEWGLDWDIPGRGELADTVRDAYQQMAALDHTRLIVDNSGWAHITTDLLDWHYYDASPARWAAKLAALADGSEEHFPVTLGPGFTVDKGLYADDGLPRHGLPILNSEYGGGTGGVEQAWLLRWQTQELRRHDRFAGYVYTELADVEHEPVGLVDAWREPKDLCQLDPAEVNAPTVLVVDLIAEAPGADMPVMEEPLGLQVRVSHHGTGVLDGIVRHGWAPTGSSLPDPLPGDTPGAAVRVEPIRLSEPVTLRVPPPGCPARLHLWLERNGVVAAHTFVDAGPTRQPGRPAILTG